MKLHNVHTYLFSDFIFQFRRCRELLDHDNTYSRLKQKTVVLTNQDGLLTSQYYLYKYIYSSTSLIIWLRKMSIWHRRLSRTAFTIRSSRFYESFLAVPAVFTTSNRSFCFAHFPNRFLLRQFHPSLPMWPYT